MPKIREFSSFLSTRKNYKLFCFDLIKFPEHRLVEIYKYVDYGSSVVYFLARENKNQFLKAQIRATLERSLVTHMVRLYRALSKECHYHTART